MSRLEDFDIRLMVEGPSVSIYMRGECMAAAGSSPDGANQGSTGLMTALGLAYLVWRDGVPYLSAKSGETLATPEQVETIRKFSEDLRTALST